MLVLRVASDPGNDGGAKALGGHDAEAPDPAAYRDVHEHVSVSPAGPGEQGGGDRAGDDDAA